MACVLRSKTSGTEIQIERRQRWNISLTFLACVAILPHLSRLIPDGSPGTGLSSPWRCFLCSRPAPTSSAPFRTIPPTAFQTNGLKMTPIRAWTTCAAPPTIRPLPNRKFATAGTTITTETSTKAPGGQTCEPDFLNRHTGG